MTVVQTANNYLPFHGKKYQYNIYSQLQQKGLKKTEEGFYKQKIIHDFFVEKNSAFLQNYNFLHTKDIK